MVRRKEVGMSEFAAVDVIATKRDGHALSDAQIDWVVDAYTRGAVVPQLSGRGLGHTGGTLDKLESIRGWRAQLRTDEFRRQLRDVGAVICAAGAGLVPADRKLYALRDVTATVEAIPLIASSIMS